MLELMKREQSAEDKEKAGNTADNQALAQDRLIGQEMDSALMASQVHCIEVYCTVLHCTALYCGPVQPSVVQCTAVCRRLHYLQFVLGVMTRGAHCTGGGDYRYPTATWGALYFSAVLGHSVGCSVQCMAVKLSALQFNAVQLSAV